MHSDAGRGVRFVRGEERVDIWLCYRCEMLGAAYFAAGATGPTHAADEDFDFVADELIRLAKEAFPEDAAIQSLPESDVPL